MLLVKVLFSFFFILILFYLFSHRGEVSLTALLGSGEGANELWLLVSRSVQCSEVGAMRVTRHLNIFFFLLQVDWLVHVAAVALFFLFNLVGVPALIDFVSGSAYFLNLWAGTDSDVGLKVGALA